MQNTTYQQLYLRTLKFDQETSFRERCRKYLLPMDAVCRIRTYDIVWTTTKTKLDHKPNQASVEPLYTTRLMTGFFTTYLQERLQFREEVALRNKCQDRSLNFPKTILVLERGISLMLYLNLSTTSPVILGQFQSSNF